MGRPGRGWALNTTARIIPAAGMFTAALLATVVFASAAHAVPPVSAAPADGGSATHFVVVAPADATAGDMFTFIVVAEDASGQTATDYDGIVDVTSTDPNATLPSAVQLASGTGQFSATLGTTGNQTLTATDANTAWITGTSTSIAVQPGPATHYSVTAPAESTAGDQLNFVVTALDAEGNVATGYTGTAGFTTSDPVHDLDVPGSLTDGVGTFPATLDTEGAQTVTATDTVDPSITGTTGPITVHPGLATSFTVTAPANAVAGEPLIFTVTGDDAFNNPGAPSANPLHFFSSDGGAVLPSDTPFSGQGNFSATLDMVGAQTVSVNDTVNPQFMGSSATITVGPPVASHFAVTSAPSATAGSPASFTVQALDAAGNTARGYSGTVHFISTDPAATFPADAQLSNGVETFQATFRTAGSTTITASDTTDSSITGSSGAITVAPAVATSFRVGTPPTAAVGAPFSFTVTALDAFGNTATGYAGMIHFTSTDGAANLPGDARLTDGTGTFDATLNSAGNRTVSATDTADPSIAGTSQAITVPAVAARTPPPPPPPPPRAPRPKPSNHFTLPHIQIKANGTITFMVKVPGPGQSTCSRPPGTTTWPALPYGSVPRPCASCPRARTGRSAQRGRSGSRSPWAGVAGYCPPQLPGHAAVVGHLYPGRRRIPQARIPRPASPRSLNPARWRGVGTAVRYRRRKAVMPAPPHEARPAVRARSVRGGTRRPRPRTCRQSSR